MALLGSLFLALSYLVCFAFIGAGIALAVLRGAHKLEAFIARKFAEDALGHDPHGDWSAVPDDFKFPHHAERIGRE